MDAAKAVVLEDQLGRQVRVPDDPKRVIALAPSITEIVYVLEEENRLAGATLFSDYPEKARWLPRVGSYVHLDLERIIALKPDLCIAVKDGNPISVISRLESFNISIYAVDPRNLAAVAETVREIGVLLHAEKKADRVALDMENRIDRIRNLSAKQEVHPDVFFQIGISPIVSVGTDTFIHELITTAGGNNLTKGPVPYPRLTKEQVIALSPDIFIITSMARETIFESIKKNWNKWKCIPAIRNERIHLVNSDFYDRATPRLVKGLEQLFRLIHPDISKEIR